MRTRNLLVEFIRNGSDKSGWILSIYFFVAWLQDPKFKKGKLRWYSASRGKGRYPFHNNTKGEMLSLKKSMERTAPFSFFFSFLSWSILTIVFKHTLASYLESFCFWLASRFVHVDWNNASCDRFILMKLLILSANITFPLRLKQSNHFLLPPPLTFVTGERFQLGCR